METTKRINLYIVDDEPGICNLIKLLFTEYGYEVNVAKSGVELLEKLEKLEKFEKEDLPDIILLDIMMPEIDGYEICKKIKNNEKLKNIKIVLYTALPEYAVKERLRQVKADAFISKDIDIEKLSKIIKDLLF